MNASALEALPVSIRDMFIAARCVHCGLQFTEGMHVGNWACARHIGTRNEDKVWSCCGRNSRTERGLARGCVRTDHSRSRARLSTAPAQYDMALYPFIKPNLEVTHSRRRGPDNGTLYVATCDEEALLDAHWNVRWCGLSAPS